MVTTHDLAVMAATLANKGVNPKTKQRVTSEKNTNYILEQMIRNGLYEESDDWFKNVGFPAKSGVGGLLMIVIPGVMGIGIASPPLNKILKYSPNLSEIILNSSSNRFLIFKSNSLIIFSKDLIDSFR